MRKLILALSIILASQAVFAQSSPIQEFMKKYDTKDATTSVVIGPSMVEMLLSSADDDEDMKELNEMFDGFEGMRILVYEDGGDEVFEQFKSKVNIDSYEELMTVKESDQTVLIIGNPKGNDTFSEIAMIVHESGGELVLMSFIGSLRKDQLKSLNKAFNMDLDEVIEER